jgi:hypothetical protein
VHKHITVLAEHSDSFRRYMFQHIVPTIREGFRLLKANDLVNPIKTIGEFFLGVDNISGCARVSLARGLVTEIILEANRALCQRFRLAPEEDPREWYATYLLTRSPDILESALAARWSPRSLKRPTRP